MRTMIVNDDEIERMGEPLTSKVKNQTGFALLVAMFMMVGVSLLILRFALHT
jgi:hypothetical protein